MSRAWIGTFQLPPTPAKNPFFAWKVTPTVARVRFSVFEIVGGKLRSVPRSVVLLRIDAVSLATTCPLTSAFSRSRLRDGNAMPVPHWNAPPGVSKPSGLPRHS